jgi:hypothetical protein
MPHLSAGTRHAGGANVLAPSLFCDGCFVPPLKGRFMPHPIIGRLFDGAALKSGSSRGSFLLFWHDRDGGTLADATANQPFSLSVSPLSLRRALPLLAGRTKDRQLFYFYD